MSPPFDGLLKSPARAGRASAPAPPFRRKLLFEALEPRILLSADLSYAAASGAALDAALRVSDVAGTQILQLVDNGSSAVLGEGALDQDLNVTVHGSELDDALSIDFDHSNFAHQIRLMFDGREGVDRLVGSGLPNVWRLSGAGTGTLDSFEFFNVENLEGGTGDDVFVVLDAAGATSIEGGAGSDTLIAADAQNAWEITGSDAGTLNAQSFGEIENLSGGAGDDTFALAPGGAVTGTISGSAGHDTLVAADSRNAWTVTGLDSGTLNGQSFAGIENLSGGAGEDTFTLAPGGAVTGGITGGAGIDTLAAADSDNTWVISGPDAGTLNGLNFAEIENLTGGAGSDTFVFAGGSISGIIDGGAGVNTIDYSTRSNSITVDLGAGLATDAGVIANVNRVVGGSGNDTLRGRNEDSLWNVSGDNAGSAGGIAFDAIENISGGSSSDTFVFTPDAALTGIVSGGLGIDFLSGADQANSWSVTNPDAGTVNGVAFADIENLLGGRGGDTFLLMAAGALSGSLSGGEGVDRLRGPERRTVWRFTGQGGGDAGGTKFSGMEAVEGGADEDTFQFDDGADFGGTVDGGAGIDSLDYSASSSAVTVDLAAGTATALLGFTNIEDLKGGTAADALKGPAADSTWTVRGANAGDVNGLIFNGFENLEGAADNRDTFVFEDGGSLSGLIDGGAAGFDTLVVNFTGVNTLVYDAYGPDSGEVYADSNGIRFVGLEPVTISGTAANLIVDASTGSDNLTLELDPSDSTRLALTDGGAPPTIETPSFAIPSTSLVIRLNSGNDTLTIGNVGTFDLGNLTVDGDAPGAAGTDEIRITRDADMALSDTSLTVAGAVINLLGVEVASLSGGAGDNTFTVDGWSGAGSLNGAGGSDTVEAAKDRDFVLTDTSLSATDGVNLTLSSIETANLTGGAGNNTFTVTGWTGTGALDGGSQAGGSDVVVLAKDADMTLSDDLLTATGGPTMDLANIERAELTGGAGDNTFTVSNWTATVQLSGQGGDDVYAFGPDHFGFVTIDGANDTGTDTLDFTELGVAPGLKVTNGGATISHGVDTITQTGGNAEEIDAALASVDVSTLQTALDDLLAFVRQMKDASGDLQALRNQLPLLDRGEVTGLADVVALTSAFEKFVVDAKTAVFGWTRLSDVVDALNNLSFANLPPPLTSLTLTVATSYRGEQADVDADPLSDDRLELLLDFELHGEASKEFKIDLGETAQNIGATVDGRITATGKLDADFSIGLSTAAAPTAFLVPGATIGLEVSATGTLSSAPINLPSLDLTGTGDLTLGGRLELTVHDFDGLDDGRIDPGAFDPGLIVVGAPIGTLTGGAFLDSTVVVQGKDGVEVDGVKIEEAFSVTFVLSLNGDAFGVATAGAVQITPEIKAVMTPGDDPVDLLDFGNISAAEILGMLQQVSDFLSAISDSEFLTIPIPFTDLTLGGVLDIGLGFKQSVIDPLFKSGDSLKPDNNGDGAVDGSDLNFSSIQQLGKHLAQTLGLDLGAGGGATSNLSFTPQYLTKGDVAVRAKAVGDDKSVQLVTVKNADGGTFKLRYDATDETTVAIDYDASADEIKTALNDALSTVTVASVTRTPKGPDVIYEITFESDPGELLEAVIKDMGKATLDSAGRKELSLRMEYTPTFGFGEARVGTELEGGNGVNEKQTVTLNAVASAPGDGLDDTFQLGLRLDAGAPLLFTSDIAWNASAAQVEAALERLGVRLADDPASSTTKQTLTLRNTGGGDFRLSQGANTTAPISFDADFLDIRNALVAAGIPNILVSAAGASEGNAFTLERTSGDEALTLGEIRSQRSGDQAPVPIDVSVTRDGKLYTVLFDQGLLAGTDVPQLVSDSSELLGELRLDFGASLGDLATLKTEGSFSAIASLTTGITFGLDLNPSQKLAIAPVVFAPGPVVEVRASTQGNGDVAEVQTVTIRNANDGTFTLTLPGGSGTSTTQPLAFDAGEAVVKSALNALTDFSPAEKNVVSVGRTVDGGTGTVTYSITFAKASGNLPELKAVGSLLKGAPHNGVLAGTDPATFTVEILNQAFDLAGGGVVRNIAERSLGSFAVTVARDPTNNSLSDLRDDVARAINEQLKAFGLGFFDAATGTLGTGALKAGGSSTATVDPLANLYNDLEFTLQLTQEVDAGVFSGSDTATTLNKAGGFSKVRVGDQVWNTTDGSKTSVKAVGETTITIGVLTGGGGNTWVGGDLYEIRRPTEVTGRLRAVDMLDRSTDVLIAGVGGTSVQTVTIKDGAQGSFVLGLGSLLTRAIAVDAPVDRPFAAVTGTNLSQQLILERAEDGTFDLTLGTKSAVNLAFNITEAALTTKLETLFGVSINTVARTVSGDTVTYAIDFATDPGALLGVDDAKLRGSSIEEALAGFDVQSISETTPGGSADRQITVVFNSAPGELLRAGNGTLLDASGALDTAEAGRTLGADDYVGPLQRAIDAALERLNAAAENAALQGAVFLDFAAKVEVQAGKLKLSASKIADPSKGADTTDGTLELRFRSPVQADAGGGKVTLSTSPVLYSTAILEAATRVERGLEVSTEFNDAAYQQLGLLTAPTRFDGKTDDKIDLTLTAKSTSGTEQKIHVVVNASTARTSIDDLVAQLQAAVNANNGSFTDHIVGPDGVVTTEGDIRVERVDPEGNRIQFVGKEGTVKSISMFVPDTAAGGGANGAITELGFKAGQGDTKRAKSTEFFIEDAVFIGDFALIADDVAATATFGFLGIRAEGEGTVDTSGKFLDASIELGLKHPEDGGSRLTPGDIVSALGDGRVFFDGGDLVAAGKTGVLDGGIAGELAFKLGIAPDGFLSGLKDDLNASLEIGVASPNWLVARPSLSDPLGFGDAKDLNDNPVTGPIMFTGAANELFKLGGTVPDSGELDTTLSFVISNDGGTTEALGVLKKEDTQAGASASTTQQGESGKNETQEIRVANATGGTFKITYDGKTSTLALSHNDTVASMETALKQLGFQVTGDPTPNVSVSVSTEAVSGDRVFRIEFVGDLAGTNVGSLGIAEDTLTRTRADLQADLQAAIDAALVELGGTPLKGKITATIDGTSGEIALAGETGFSIRGNTIEVKFTGPDFDGLLAQFKDLSFRDIIAGLEKAVEFLQTLDGSDGSPAKVPELNTTLPLINRSVSDLLDPAKDFLEFVDGVAANPAGSVQQLNVILADALGFAAPVASVDVTSPAAIQTVSLHNVSAGTFTLQLGDMATDAILLVSDSQGALDTHALETSVAAELGAITGGAVIVVVDEVPSSDILSSNLTLTITFANPQDPLVVDGSRLIALDILSLNLADSANPILEIDFGFGVGANVSRPFDLDLADAIGQLGLPDFLTNLVSLDARGSLAVEADVDLNLAFGLDLTGNDKAMFIRTADTGINAQAEATADGLEFGAKIGPFGLFVVDGEAGLNGLIDIGLVDADHDGRLVLVGISPGVSNDFDHLGSFFSTAGITVELTGGAQLPLFIGTEDNKLPLDFGTATPGTENSLIVSLDALEIFDGTADGDNGIDITFPQVSVDFLSDLPVPSLFALLSDPAVVLDGLDRLLLTLQEALNGQVMGIELPFLGALLAENPAANIIGDFRDDLLKPLARTIRESNLDLDGLIGLIQDTLFDALGPAGPFASFGGLLKDSADPGTDITVDDIVVRFLDASGAVVTPDPLFSNAQALQFDFDLGKSETFETDIDFDLGVPAIGIEVDLQPEVSIDFNLHFGFGIDQNEGFYFVTDFDREANDPDGTAGKGLLDDELSLDIVVDFGSTQLDRKSATGRLVVLALTVTDGVDTDGDGELEFSNLALHAGVDLRDPGGDGRLGFSEMTSGSLSDIFVVGATGSAALRLEGEVDFSTLDASLASVLPSISTNILVDFSIDAAPGTGITVHPPEVAFLDVTLDLGAFISDFAAPILEKVANVLGPLDWLIGPDGFLNKRIPLLSDLLGKTVTGKDLIVLYDPKNGPKVVAFLDFVEQLYFLTELVTDAAAQAKDGSIMINFGDVVLFDDAGGG
ncbi:MAG TPA: LEPR-XLL domain-containing protein, partial [Burkholderiales bacterium]|nr:LEPR-XLL domain-containing protein [Burkholderiales bacterium]